MASTNAQSNLAISAYDNSAETKGVSHALIKNREESKKRVKKLLKESKKRVKKLLKESKKRVKKFLKDSHRQAFLKYIVKGSPSLLVSPQLSNALISQRDIVRLLPMPITQHQATTVLAILLNQTSVPLDAMDLQILTIKQQPKQLGICHQFTKKSQQKSNKPSCQSEKYDFKISESHKSNIKNMWSNAIEQKNQIVNDTADQHNLRQQTDFTASQSESDLVKEIENADKPSESQKHDSEYTSMSKHATDYRHQIGNGTPSPLNSPRQLHSPMSESNNEDLLKKFSSQNKFSEVPAHPVNETSRPNDATEHENQFASGTTETQILTDQAASSFLKSEPNIEVLHSLLSQTVEHQQHEHESQENSISTEETDGKILSYPACLGNEQLRGFLQLVQLFDRQTVVQNVPPTLVTVGFTREMLTISLTAVSHWLMASRNIFPDNIRMFLHYPILLGLYLFYFEQVEAECVPNGITDSKKQLKEL